MFALSRKDAWFLFKAISASILLPVALVGIWGFCVDWRGPLDDLPETERAHMEECAFAQRELGDALLRERPDCRTYARPHATAAVITTGR